MILMEISFVIISYFVLGNLYYLLEEYGFLFRERGSFFICEEVKDRYISCF